MNRDKAIELANGYIFSQWPKLFEPEGIRIRDDWMTSYEVLLDLGSGFQAYLRVYPDEGVELIFFGQHDELDLE